jgi:glycosyltransferase involved in cell wall biosynthesis
MEKLSIIIPVYNEEKFVYNILSKIHDVTLLESIEKEVLVINDGSVDKTKEEVQRFQQDFPESPCIFIDKEKNMGKGAAIHTGIDKATGDYLIVQDADLEYDPEEITLLLKPALNGFADVVYGSRFIGGKPHRCLFFLHTLGNKFLTFLTNILNDINLTDMETCYKLFRASVIKNVSLKEKRFGFEPEVTIKVACKKEVRVYEVGISYYGRTYEEGKKINWKDGCRAVYCILKYSLQARVFRKA